MNIIQFYPIRTTVYIDSSLYINILQSNRIGRDFDIKVTGKGLVADSYITNINITVLVNFRFAVSAFFTESCTAVRFVCHWSWSRCCRSRLCNQICFFFCYWLFANRLIYYIAHLFRLYNAFRSQHRCGNSALCRTALILKYI